MSPQPFCIARLPIPPGINRSYQVVYIGRHARIADTPEAKAFKEAAALALHQSAIVNWTVVDMVRNATKKMPLSINIQYFFKTMWLRDLDGGDKAVIDCVFKYLRLNDNLLVALYATKQVDKNDPRVEVKVSLIEE